MFVESVSIICTPVLGRSNSDNLADSSLIPISNKTKVLERGEKHQIRPNDPSPRQIVCVIDDGRAGNETFGFRAMAAMTAREPPWKCMSIRPDQRVP